MDSALEDRDGFGVDLCLLPTRPAPAKRPSLECVC